VRGETPKLESAEIKRGISMTAQISDTIIFEGERYSIIGLRGSCLFTPMQFGMEPEGMHTACYRGFYATYELTDEELFLRELTIRDRNGRYPPISGVDAVTTGHEATYTNLAHQIQFSGEIRFAKDFIEELYIHMGFQKPTAFKTVYDTTLENGKLVDVKDRSREMEEKRGAFRKQYEAENIAKRIEDSFSLDMDIE
jgi:hypothetical protein